MKKRQRKNGFILLIVVTMIPLIGMVLAIMTANSKSLMIMTRREELQAQADNACQSALAWVKQNPAKVTSLDVEKAIPLTINNNGKPINCSVELLSPGEEQYTIQVSGYAKDSLFSVECQQKITYLRNIP